MNFKHLQLEGICKAVEVLLNNSIIVLYTYTNPKLKHLSKFPMATGYKNMKIIKTKNFQDLFLFHFFVDLKSTLSYFIFHSPTFPPPPPPPDLPCSLFIALLCLNVYLI